MSLAIGLAVDDDELCAKAAAMINRGLHDKLVVEFPWLRQRINFARLL